MVTSFVPLLSLFASVAPCNVTRPSFAPIPAPSAASAASDLGRRLFHDPRLSQDGTVSCASCHPLNAYGIDGLPRARGINGQVGPRNTPTVYNVTLNARLMWSGAVATVEEQAGLPITNGVEMAATWPSVLARLRADPELNQRFREAFDEGLTETTVRQAIGAFERTLMTPGAPFDRFLCGYEDAIDSTARQGFELFDMYGCSSCHQGINLGGNLFQPLGVLVGERGPVVRVPPLRNVAKTAPYLHDGSVSTLPEVVRLMAESQLAVELDDSEVASIVAFLESLTAPLPRDL